MRRLVGFGLLLMMLTSFRVWAQDKPAVPPEDDVSARLVVPQGFAVRAFAKGLSRPRLMTVGDVGSLYVAEMGANQVSRLIDADGDGLAEKRDVIAKNMSLAHNVEWHDGWLYVAEGNQIERIQDVDGDGIFEKREVVTTDIPDAVHHISRTVHFGPDGKMYV